MPGEPGNIGGTGGTETPTATPPATFTYTTKSYEEYITIAGGAVSSIKAGGITVATTIGWFGRVPPLTAVEITYNTAPTLRFAQAVNA